MSQEKIITILKYLLIAWVAVGIVFGLAYLTMIWIVLEMISQLGEMAK
jgi:hypothetical protein